MRFEKGCEGQTPRAPRHLVVVQYLDVVLRREAAIKPAALRPCAKFEWIHDVDIDRVWGPRPQEIFYNSVISSESQQTMERHQNA